MDKWIVAIVVVFFMFFAGMVALDMHQRREILEICAAYEEDKELCFEKGGVL